MRSTGIVRRVDELGRVVLPIELRRTLGINEGEPLEIFVDGETIVLKRYAPGCVFCGEATDTIVLHGKHVCRGCASELSK